MAFVSRDFKVLLICNFALGLCVFVLAGFVIYTSVECR